MTDIRLLLPHFIHAAPAIHSNLYFDNVVLAPDSRSLGFEVICGKGAQLDERWSFTPAADDVGEHPIELVVRDQGSRVVSSARSIVRVASESPSEERPVTLLLIGDSLTAQAGYPRRLLELSRAETGLRLRLVGSQGPSTDSELRHEGYGGWSAETFVHPDGPRPHAEQTSPFLGERGLDFERYFARHNAGQPPDVVSIFLGTNDIFLATDGTIEAQVDRMLTNYDLLIGEIHRVGPDTRIGVVLTTPPSQHQSGFQHYVGAEFQTRWQYRRNQHRVVERLIEHFGGREAESIDLVPAYLNLDTARNFPASDGVHPALEGFFQIADSIYCWLRSTLPKRLI